MNLWLNHTWKNNTTCTISFSATRYGFPLTFIALLWWRKWVFVVNFYGNKRRLLVRFASPPKTPSPSLLFSPPLGTYALGTEIIAWLEQNKHINSCRAKNGVVVFYGALHIAELHENSWPAGQDEVDSRSCDHFPLHLPRHGTFLSHVYHSNRSLWQLPSASGPPSTILGPLFPILGAQCSVLSARSSGCYHISGFCFAPTLSAVF